MLYKRFFSLFGLKFYHGLQFGRTGSVHGYAGDTCAVAEGMKHGLEEAVLFVTGFQFGNAGG